MLVGLERGLAGEPADFTIVTKDAGPGGLALAVHGPSKAEITCQDNGDGTCSVQYVPEEPGKMRINNFCHKFKTGGKVKKSKENHAIGHFRVVVSLIMKVRLSAKLFI